MRKPHRLIERNVWFPGGESIWVRIGVALPEKAWPTLGVPQKLSASLLQTRMDVLSPCSSACLPPYALSGWTGTHPLSCINKEVPKMCHAPTFNRIFSLPEQTKQPVWQSLLTPNATPPPSPSPNTTLHLREKASQQHNSIPGKPGKISQMSSSCHQHYLSWSIEK